ncbi:hypothetical protein V3331_09785 [Gaopeijia maritima]|uniref:hypothetical protein n=1 Tax=Gaopeijia maritima TaxID=3119007 RepID=UPI00324578F8
MIGAPLDPIHHCPTCGGPVDPLQATGPDGGCPRLHCRLRARERTEREIAERTARRTATALRGLRERQLDPPDDEWALVPHNDATEVALDASLAADFRRHLARVIAEAGRGPHTGGPPAADASIDHSGGARESERIALARACATCRGRCCRRGGAHAFLDASSIARVCGRQPEWTDEELTAAYLEHLRPTHLEGGCLFQGPAGCRLPQSLRSDTCNRWWCPDLETARARWAEGEGSPSTTTFIAVPVDD